MGSVLTRVLGIQRTGSSELRNNLLKDLRDEAFKIAKIYCHKIGRKPSDEVFSIALRAMNEAIDLFDTARNASFITFASHVIFSRLREFFRKEKEKDFIAYNHSNMALISNTKAIAEFKRKELSEDLQDELARFKQILENVGYTVVDVMKNKPKHNDSLEKLQRIALHIVSLNLGKRFLTEDPMTRELKRMIGVADNRLLVKYRPYLCALIIVFIYDDFLIIKSYLGFKKEEMCSESQGDSY